MDEIIDAYDMVTTAENTEDFSNLTDAERKAWQNLVDTGLAFRLQGWFGRRATELLEAGEIV